MTEIQVHALSILFVLFKATSIVFSSCNYGVKEYSVLSDSFTAGFAFIDGYCQSVVTTDAAMNFEFVCNKTANGSFVGVIAKFAENGMS